MPIEGQTSLRLVRDSRPRRARACGDIRPLPRCVSLSLLLWHSQPASDPPSSLSVPSLAPVPNLTALCLNSHPSRLHCQPLKVYVSWAHLSPPTSFSPKRQSRVSSGFLDCQRHVTLMRPNRKHLLPHGPTVPLGPLPCPQQAWDDPRHLTPGTACQPPGLS